MGWSFADVGEHGRDQQYVKPEPDELPPKIILTCSSLIIVMIGTHVDAVIANALTRGFKDFDIDKAWEAVKKNAFVRKWWQRQT